MHSWVIITSEYPPAAGGVSDYTRQLAVSLAKAGDHVDVWTSSGAELAAHDDGVFVHRLPDRFGPASWRALSRALRDQRRNVTLLLQYVPHAFGLRAMNLPFLLWLAARPEPLWLMVHEAVFPFVRGQPLKHDLLAVVTRAMLAVIGSRADRIFVSVPAWRPYLERYARLRRAPEWLPVPSNLPTSSDATKTQLCERFGIPPVAEVLVHFGTYSEVVAAPLRAATPRLLRDHPDRWLVLLGRNGERFRDQLLEDHPELRKRVVATGELPPRGIADALSGGDIAVFPFPDGVSGRRGSCMAALALGVPVLATEGASTEPFWRQQEIVTLVSVWNAEALALALDQLFVDPALRRRLAERGRTAYARSFSIERTTKILRGNENGQAAS